MGYGVAIYKGKGGAEAYGQDGWYAGDPNQYKTAYVQIPTNAQKDDLLVLGVVYRNVNILSPTNSGDNKVNTPAGWTTSIYAHAGTGIGGEAAESGVTYTTIFYRIVQSDAEAGTYVTLTWPWSMVQTIWTTTYIARVYCYSKQPDSDWSISFVASAYADFPTTRFWNTSNWISSDGREAIANDTVLCISGVNSGTITWSAHQIVGNHIFFNAGTEVEDYGCGHTHGSRMTTSTSLCSYGTASTANLWNTMTGNVDGTNAPSGSSICTLIRTEPWPILKRRTGGTWVRSNMKRRISGTWSYIDNGVSNKILKRRISGTWDPVSCLYIAPSPTSINESTGNGAIFNISINSGNQVSFVPWQTSVGGIASSESATWITVTPSRIHGNETISVQVAANTGEERTAIIYMQVDGTTIWDTTTQISVTQGALIPYVTWTLPGYLIWDQWGSSCQGISYFTVTSNTNWYLDNIPSWLDISMTSGGPGTSVPISIITTGSYNTYDNDFWLMDSTGQFQDYVQVKWQANCPA